MHERPTNARSKQPALLDMHCCADRLLLCWHTRTHLNFVTFNRYETHTHKSAGEIACYICQVYIIIHDTYTGYVYITYIKKKKKCTKKKPTLSPCRSTGVESEKLSQWHQPREVGREARRETMRRMNSYSSSSLVVPIRLFRGLTHVVYTYHTRTYVT